MDPKNSGTATFEKIENLLNTLSYREREVIKLLYGIADGYTYTYEDV